MSFCGCRNSDDHVVLSMGYNQLKDPLGLALCEECQTSTLPHTALIAAQCCYLEGLQAISCNPFHHAIEDFLYTNLFSICFWNKLHALMLSAV